MYFLSTLKQSRKAALRKICTSALTAALVFIVSLVSAQPPAPRVPHSSGPTAVSANPALVTYNLMPQEVQLKMDANKAGGKSDLEGILKGYTINISACTTVASMESMLDFLNGTPDFIRSEFVSAGTIHAVVEPSYNSVTLKEALVAKGIAFSFVNEYFFVNE
jgi:hypothetical protein